MVWRTAPYYISLSLGVDLLIQLKKQVLRPRGLLGLGSVGSERAS